MTADISPENVARIAVDCRLAAKVMEDVGTFESGQSIFLETADMLEALSARLAEVEATCERLREGEANLSRLLNENARSNAAETKLAASEAQVAKLREALIWCSGSDDFQDGGKAREGWLKLCAPLIQPTALQEAET